MSGYTLDKNAFIKKYNNITAYDYSNDFYRKLGFSGIMDLVTSKLDEKKNTKHTTFDIISLSGMSLGDVYAHLFYGSFNNKNNHLTIFIVDEPTDYFYKFSRDFNFFFIKTPVTIKKLVDNLISVISNGECVEKKYYSRNAFKSIKSENIQVLFMLLSGLGINTICSLTGKQQRFIYSSRVKVVKILGFKNFNDFVLRGGKLKEMILVDPLKITHQ
ncbi:TPA: hypothetical protein MC498_005734 [Klebsiella oxytoca]|nr:hypothetical protein [Klebsiella oxytoca]